MCHAYYLADAKGSAGNNTTYVSATIVGLAMGSSGDVENAKYEDIAY
jgi:hypothetical protein